MDATWAVVARLDDETQRVRRGVRRERRGLRRVGDVRIPGERRLAIVVAIVPLALPVAWQPRDAPRDARRLFEAAVLQQFGVQAELDALEHELEEVAVELRADPIGDLRRIDADGRGERRGCGGRCGPDRRALAARQD